MNTDLLDLGKRKECPMCAPGCSHKSAVRCLGIDLQSSGTSCRIWVWPMNNFFIFSSTRTEVSVKPQDVVGQVLGLD